MILFVGSPDLDGFPGPARRIPSGTGPGEGGRATRRRLRLVDAVGATAD
jgi:hypothetical protein